MSVEIIIGDALEQLREMPDNSVDMVCSSPPYWGLRDYEVDGQLGLEPTLGEHIEAMVAVGNELWRVLKPTGTFWLNYGDSYATSVNGRSAADTKSLGNDDRTFRDKPFSTVGPIYPPDPGNPFPDVTRRGGGNAPSGPVYRPNYEKTPRCGKSANGGNVAAAHGGRIVAGGVLKPKDLCGVPWRVAFALQDAGWWLRQDIIWSKPNPMPESIADRCTKAHEYLFLLAKSGSTTCWQHRDSRLWVYAEPAPDYRWKHRENGVETAETQTSDEWRRINLWRGFDYYFDQDAITEGRVQDENANGFRGGSYVGGQPGNRATVGNKRIRGLPPRHSKYTESSDQSGLDGVGRSMGRNKRSVWTVATQPFSEAHFATFPPALIEPCILAGCPVGGTVLDPFFGAGTTGLVASRLGRACIGIDLNPEYAEIARTRIRAALGQVKCDLAEPPMSGPFFDSMEAA